MAGELALVGNILYYLFLSAAIQLADAPLPTMLIGPLPIVIAIVSNFGSEMCIRDRATFVRYGMRRWVPPLEGDRRLIETLHRSRPAGVETEVFVFGKLPLAFSARCFTARRYNLNKDDCQFKCLDHPEGLTLRTRTGQPFLTINGIQTMSAQTYNLLPQMPDLLDLGIEVAVSYTHLDVYKRQMVMMSMAGFCAISA